MGKRGKSDVGKRRGGAGDNRRTAALYGINRERVESRGHGVQPVWVVRCGAGPCQNLTTRQWGVYEPTESMVKQLRSMGWFLGLGVRPICPSCRPAHLRMSVADQERLDRFMRPVDTASEAVDASAAASPPSDAANRGDTMHVDGCRAPQGERCICEAPDPAEPTPLIIADRPAHELAHDGAPIISTDLGFDLPPAAVPQPETWPPAFFPCGCSRQKVELGLCSVFDVRGIVRAVTPAEPAPHADWCAFRLHRTCDCGPQPSILAIQTPRAELDRVYDARTMRLVHEHLGRFYGEDTGRYALNWNDARVAKSCGVSIEVVSEIRRLAYAPLAADPELVSLHTRVEAVIDSLGVLLQQINAKLAEGPR